MELYDPPNRNERIPGQSSYLRMSPKLDFPQFLSCAGLCGGPEDVLGGDELEGAIDR